MAPHVCEELWQAVGYDRMLAAEPWPAHDPAALILDEATVVVQVNGRLRGRVIVPATADNDEIEKAALAEPNVVKHIEGKTIHKVVVIAGKLVNVVAT